MKVLFIATSFVSLAMAFTPVSQFNAATSLNSVKLSLNPTVNSNSRFNLDVYGQGEDSSIAFAPQTEIKHSRIATAAFIGFCVQSNFHWSTVEALFAPKATGK